jgi:hypothetical protein
MTAPHATTRALLPITTSHVPAESYRARPFIPHRTVLLRAPCFFKRPDRETNNTFIYCMALPARKSRVGIVCVGTRPVVDLLDQDLRTSPVLRTMENENGVIDSPGACFGYRRTLARGAAQIANHLPPLPGMRFDATLW